MLDDEVPHGSFLNTLGFVTSCVNGENGTTVGLYWTTSQYR